MDASAKNRDNPLRIWVCKVLHQPAQLTVLGTESQKARDLAGFFYSDESLLSHEIQPMRCRIDGYPVTLRNGLRSIGGKNKIAWH
jgi:hypothetical protein